ncbi:MAG: cytochrome c biogenesis protein ResB [Acidobacteria bacterium]|nr:cytochrome c biogenesis protein ResB [Acidobacteriota bacterium]
MSAVEDSIKPKGISKPRNKPILNRFLDFLSSVRFGIVLLCLLVFLSMLGMLIIQQNVQGFDAAYATRTPAEKLIYGYLGLFDIYNSWYYNGLLLLLSLNIILASIDRFPTAWKYIVKPKLSATRGWLLNQQQNAVLTLDGDNEREIAGRLEAAFREKGLKTRVSDAETKVYGVDADGKKNFGVTETKKQLIVFGESGRTNRLGAYLVHVFLLTLFLGHFVAHQTGFDADVRLSPDTNPQIQRDFDVQQKTDSIQMVQINLDKQERYTAKLPFTITCTEIGQKLIDPNGSLETTNTMDWHTKIQIDDPQYGQTVADVSLNRPFSYRGYRFFQASTLTMGSASSMTLELKPEKPDAQPVTVNLKRNETTELPDGTKVAYNSFLPDFTLKGGQPSTQSGDYNNPAVVLDVTPPAGNPVRVFAFANKLPDNAPINAPKAGYRWRLASFEKSPVAHILSIKYDPFGASFIAWYIGGFGLIGALMFVFFFAHRRIWALIEKTADHRFEVVLGGDANRNNQAFEDKFKTIIESLTSNQMSESKNQQ